MQTLAFGILFCFSCNFQASFLKKGNDVYMFSKGASKPLGLVWNLVPVCTKFKIFYAGPAYKGTVLRLYLRHKRYKKNKNLIFSFMLYKPNKNKKYARMQLPPIIESGGRWDYHLSFMEGEWEASLTKVRILFPLSKGKIILFSEKKECRKKRKRK